MRAKVALEASRPVSYSEHIHGPHECEGDGAMQATEIDRTSIEDPRPGQGPVAPNRPPKPEPRLF